VVFIPSLTSTFEMPVEPVPITTTRISKHCHLGPGRWHLQLRTTGLEALCKLLGQALMTGLIRGYIVH
jgi:hypothetical protein